MGRLSGYLVAGAEAGLPLAEEGGGRMPAGHNGPWNDDVTHLRNTGHWAVLFFDAYERTGDRRFYDAATDCIGELCRDAARPEGYAFFHRTEPGKDRCNGLVGQGWSIEALAVADRYMSSSTPRSVAEEVFLLHPFDEETELWHSVGVDGTVHEPFSTVNQQLWFAAAGSLLCRNGGAPAIRSRVDAFLSGLDDTLRTYRDGRVYHSSYPYSDLTFLGQRVGARLWGRSEHIDTLSTGYHSFNLYALAILKRSLPDHPVWSSGLVEELLAPIGTVAYKDGVSNNVYSFGYNPTGFEVAFALETFRGDVGRFWVNEQFRRCYDTRADRLSGGWDGETLSARLYEATRLADREITVVGSTAADERRSAGAARSVRR